MALALRLARQLQHAARQHLVTQAQQQWEEAAAASSSNLETGEQQRSGGGGAAAGTATQASSGGTGSGRRGNAAGALAGQAVVCALDETSDALMVQRALELWQQQRSFAWAVVPGVRRLNKPAAAATTADPRGNAAGGSSGGNAGASPQDSEMLAMTVLPMQAAASARAAQAAAAAAALPVGASLVDLTAPAQIALCWSEREVLLLTLPAHASVTSSSSAAVAVAAPTSEHNAAAAAAVKAAQRYSSAVWSAVRTTFADPARTAICCDASNATAALEAAGVACHLQLHDPLAAFRLWQPGAEAEVKAAAAAEGAAAGTEEDMTSRLITAAQRAVLPAWRLQLPLRFAPAAIRAARAALLARTLHAPLRSLVASRGLARLYERVSLPLLRCAAAARTAGLALRPHSLRDLLSETRLQIRLLQEQQLPRLAAVAVAALGPQPPHQLPPPLRPGVDADVAMLLQQIGLGRQKRGQPATGEAGILGALRRLLLKGAGPADSPTLPLLQALLTEVRLRAVEAAASELLGLVDYQGGGTIKAGGVSAADGSSGGTSSSTDLVLHPELRCLPLLGTPSTALPPTWQRLAAWQPLALPAVPVLARTCSAGTNPKRPLLPLAAPMAIVLQQEQQPLSPEQLEGTAGDGVSATGLNAAAAAAAGSANAALPGAPSPYPCIALLVDAAPARRAVAPDCMTDGWGLVMSHGGSRAATAAAPAPTGRVRGWACGGGDAAEEEWMGSTERMREVVPLAAAFEQPAAGASDQQAQGQERKAAGIAPGEAALLLARGTATLRGCIVPAAADCMFVGVRFVDLQIVLFAALSGEPVLQQAVRQCYAPSPPATQDLNPRRDTNTRPLHAAAAAWLSAWCARRGGDSARAMLRAAASGVQTGSPLPELLAGPAVFSALLQAVGQGDRPGKVAEVLGCDALAAGGAVASLWECLPGVGRLRQQVVDACGKTGCVRVNVLFV